MRRRFPHMLKKLIVFCVVILVMSIVFISAIPNIACANTKQYAQQDKKVVKVGYYLYEGYQEVSDEGVFSGYGYDYLKEISQFAGWKYEFIIEDFDKCIELLEKGEIDLVGGINKEELQSKNIIYSRFSNGDSQNQLFTSNKNSELNFNSFDKFQGLSVGIKKGDYQEECLNQYCNQHGFTLRKKYYESTTDMERALENNEIQLMYTSVEDNEKYNKIVGKMDSKPLYYGANKNNVQLIKELDDAIENINNSNPSYDMQIQNKYFIKGQNVAPSFTDEELEYIKKKGLVRVAYDEGWQPIEYYDKETKNIKGVTKDLFDLLENYTGLKFEFVRAKILSDALEFVKTGEADMISLVSHNYNVSEDRGIYTSSLCINAALVGVIAKDRNFEKIEQIAMPEDYYLDILKNYKVSTYKTVEECFEAVNSGKADATIANAYNANYYLANPKFVNLIRQDLIGYSEDLSLGVSQKEDISLLNILNKGLHCISDMDLSNIILSNYVIYEQPKFRKLYYSNPALFLGIIMFSVIAIICALSYVIVLKNKVNSTSLKMIEFLNVEKERVENSLRAEAERDALTGLFNRRKIESEIKEFLLKISVDNQIGIQMTNSGNKDLYCLIILDLDRFKNVNDRFGHPEGDLLLKRVATEFGLIAGDENLAGRLGGDEFVFLFKTIASRREAQHIAEKIQKVVEQISSENERWNGVTVSEGITLFGCDTYSFKQLYENTDRALYKAKKTGKNKFVFYDEI